MFINRKGLQFFRELLSKTGFSNETHIRSIRFYLKNESVKVAIILKVLQIMTFMLGLFP